MADELVTKEVDFFGDTLMCAKNNQNGKIYVGLRWICNGIGFTRGQINNENKRVQSDLVLKMGCTKFDAGVFDENNATIAIELDTLPLWLAKISITPKMQSENPILVNKLVNYQLKAKDVLAKAFINPQEVNIDKFNIPATLSEALLLSANLAKENEELKPKAEQYDYYIDSDGTISLNEAAKALHTGRNKMMEFLRDKDILNNDNSPSQRCLNSGYFEVKTFTYVVRNGNKYQVAITRVTTSGLSFLYNYLKKHLDLYHRYDSKFNLSECEVNI